jgi:ubiquinone/menaquinone biosynthesis C-methylase UbiE
MNEQAVAAHYSRSGLEQAILEALAKSGKDVERLQAADLAGADELHLGWRPATVEFAEALGFARGARVLDIGAGIGGPARHFAQARGCHVTGLDLSDDFVQAATGLSRRCGLAESVSFKRGSALAMPFDAAAFDGAYMIHVAMNIEDKAKLFAEARRVLKPGARFGIYDIMRAAPGDIPYPMPWAASTATSFVATPETYKKLLTAAGFTIESERDRSAFVRALGNEMREKAAKEGSAPLNLRIVTGTATPGATANVMGTLERGIIAPVELIARAG